MDTRKQWNKVLEDLQRKQDAAGALHILLRGNEKARQHLVQAKPFFFPSLETPSPTENTHFEDQTETIVVSLENNTYPGSPRKKQNAKSAALWKGDKWAVLHRKACRRQMHLQTKPPKLILF